MTTLLVRFLGLELLHIELSTDAAEGIDTARDLSGGTTGIERIDAGPTDRYLGFTNGREES